MKLKRNTLNLISILLTLVMLISNITVFGAGSSSMTSGSGGYSASGNGSDEYSWDDTNNSEFLRVSVYWAPYAKEGEPADTWGLNWSSSQAEKVGSTFDWSISNCGNVKKHSNFSDVYYYHKNGYDPAWITTSDMFPYAPNSATDTSQVFLLGTDLGGMSFPTPVKDAKNGKSNSSYTKQYFENPNVLNEVAWLLKNTPKGKYDGRVQQLTVDHIQNGIFVNDYGELMYGGYLIIVEPGMYAYINDTLSAFTLRDAISWGRGSTPISYLPSGVHYLAISLTLEQNRKHGNIGLERGTESNSLDADEIKKLRDNNTYKSVNGKLSKYMGVGTSIYWGNGEPIVPTPEPLPIIKYYYDFAEQDSEEDDESQVNEMLTNIAVFNDANYVNIEKINKKKYSASMRDLPDELTYGAYKNPESGEAEDNLYKLSNILILNTNQQGDTDSNIIFEQNNKYNTMEATGKSALGGYVDIDTDGRVKFFATDANGEIINSEEGYWLTSNAGSRILRYADIEAWENVTGSSSLPDDRTIGDSAINNGIAGLARMCLGSLGFNTDETQEKFVDIERKNNVNNIIAIEAMAADQQVLETEHTMRLSNIIAAWKDNVEFNMNQFESTGSQLVLLYTRNEPTLSTPSPTPGDTPTPPPPGIKVMSTNINTYFYDSINSEAPINIASEELAILDLEGSVSKYTIQPEIMAGDDKYTLVDWVTLEDENPEGPDLLPTWTDVLEHIDTGYEQHGDTAGDWIDWTNPDRELNIRYVLATDDLQYPASVVIPQNKITRAVSVRDITANKPNVKFNWLQVSGSDSHRHNKHSHSCSKVINDGSLTLLASCLNEETFTGSNIVASVKDFKGFDENNTYSTTRTKSSGSKTMYSYDYNYVIWRGLDIPVLADYKYKGINSTNYSIINSLINRNALYVDDTNLLEDRRDKWRNENNNGSYASEYEIRVGKSNNDTNENSADYVWTTKHSYKNTSWDSGSATGNSMKYLTNAQVNVYYGNPNTGNAEVSSASNTSIKSFDGTEFGTANQYGINNTQPLKFFPYVEMTYDYVKENNIIENIGVYTLAGHESQMYPRDFIEIGYKTSGNSGKDTTTGLLIESQQWSTHASALKLSKSKGSSADHTARVLPGGAIYRLRTPNEGDGKSNRTKVAVRTYLTYVPDDISSTGAIKEGGNAFSLNSQLARKDGLLHQVKRSMNSLDVVQITQDSSGNSIKLNQGQSIRGASGQPISTDSKYWLQQGKVDGSASGASAINSTAANEADLDLINENSKAVYYRIQSDVYGNVKLTKTGDTGNAEWKIDKTQGADKLISQADELKDLDNKTKLITNYLNSIDRNQGSDENGNTWYNEAFDGLGVVVVEDIFEVGFSDNQSDYNNVARTAVLDTKLQPERKSQSDIYGSGVYSHFETKSKTNMGGTEGYTISSHGETVTIPAFSDEDGYVGTYTPFSGTADIKIYMPNMSGIYRSKDFIIPNISVMDLY